MTTCKILIVDDDEDDREILTEAFQEFGLERVHGVESAEKALAYLQAVVNDEDLPKLIITDLNMPGITGQELLNALKGMRRYKHIPVIVCSTSSSPLDIERCLAAGAKYYVTKPSEMTGYVDITQKLSSMVLS